MIWSLLCPVLIYGLATDLCSLLFREWEPLARTMSGALLALPVLVRLYRGQAGRRGRPCRLDKKEAGLLSLSGIAACLMVNTLIKISRIWVLFPGFSRESARFYGPPLYLQVWAMGVVIPIAEELVFRGLGFGRLREKLDFWQSALLSSVLFAFWHGNVVQGLYGFCMGLLFSWAMERDGTVLAPIFMHIWANLASVALTAVRGVW